MGPLTAMFFFGIHFICIGIAMYSRYEEGGYAWVLLRSHAQTHAVVERLKNHGGFNLGRRVT